MRFVPSIVTTLAILLTACSPAALAQTPPATSPAAATSIAPATNTEMAVAEDTPTTAATNTATTTAIAQTPVEATLANVTRAASATMPAAVAEAFSQNSGVKYESFASPVDLLASYYNAINRKEYQRAYGYWQNPPLPYNTFANGFSDTTGVQLIVQPPTHIDAGAGNLYTAIPTLLVAQHTDGSIHTYAGCIVTHKSNLHPPDIPQEDVWHLSQASLQEVANNANIPALLAQACAAYN